MMKKGILYVNVTPTKPEPCQLQLDLTLPKKKDFRWQDFTKIARWCFLEIHDARRVVGVAQDGSHVMS